MEKYNPENITNNIAKTSKSYFNKNLQTDDKKERINYPESITSLIAKTSQSYFNKNYENKEEGKKVEEDARRLYLKMFDDQEEYHKDDEFWWKKQFEESAKSTINDFIKNFKEKQEQNEEKKNNLNKQALTIYFDKNLLTFEGSNELILFGRKSGCEISTSSKNCEISRLHLLIFILYEINKIVMVDPGSFHGIKTLKRSKEYPLVNRLPGNRQLLVFDMDEIVELEIKEQKILLNPKECLICFEKARDFTFGCGHYVACEDCIKKLQDCPLCRKSINVEETIKGLQIKTKLNF